MKPTEPLRQSPLLDLHPGGAKYEAVGDSSVAWIYSDFEQEYEALRTNAALFDHSSVGLFSVSGEGAVAFLDMLLARDVAYLTPELCMPSLVLDEAGQMVDIVNVYSLGDRYLLETSFGNGSAMWRHLQAHRTAGAADLTLEDLRTTDAIVGIEGPYAWGFVGRIIDAELTALPFQTVLQTTWDNRPIWFSRSGFTAEYGYKVIGSIETLAALWEQANLELPPAGQAVLETSMLEVKQPLPHRQVVGDTNVVEAGFNWLLDRSKDSFVGREAVEAMWQAGPRSLMVTARSPLAIEAGAEVRAGTVPIGQAISSAPSPGLDAHLVLLQVDPNFAAAGLDLAVNRPPESVAVTTLSPPYLVPASWSVPIF